MTFKDYFQFGYLSKSIGISGQLAIELDVDTPEKYAQLDVLFADLGGDLVPLFVRKIKINAKRAIVDLEGVDNKKKADDLIGKQVFLPVQILPSLSGNDFYFHEIIGFEVIDKKNGNIGKINQVLEFPHQNLLEIKNEKAEILVPIVKHFILEVNRAEKTMFLDCPEGLIDIYLEEKKK
jgi:16S rRNA processing protein RimM